tara:strand:+ start:180 stop:329 length:150 start_codon:yes stop_codon:yes gene_type:complete
MKKKGFQSLLELLAINFLLLALIFFMVPVLPFWIFLILAVACYWKIKKL